MNINYACWLCKHTNNCRCISLKKKTVSVDFLYNLSLYHPSDSEKPKSINHHLHTGGAITQFRKGNLSKRKCEMLTNNNPIGKYEKLNIGCKSAKHKSSRDHDPTEDGHRSGPEVHNTGTADGTCVKGRMHHPVRQ